MIFPQLYRTVSEYLKFPKVFEYDDYEECRREHRDEYAFCVVHATISPDESSELYRNLTVSFGFASFF